MDVTGLSEPNAMRGLSLSETRRGAAAWPQ